MERQGTGSTPWTTANDYHMPLLQRTKRFPQTTLRSSSNSSRKPNAAGQGGLYPCRKADDRVHRRSAFPIRYAYAFYHRRAVTSRAEWWFSRRLRAQVNSGQDSTSGIVRIHRNYPRQSTYRSERSISEISGERFPL